MKRLSPELDIDEKTFKNELISLIRVKHKNIVRFLGYCVDTQGKVELYQRDMVIADIRQRLLCFEFLPNGGLDKHMNGMFPIFHLYGKKIQKKNMANVVSHGRHLF